MKVMQIFIIYQLTQLTPRQSVLSVVVVKMAVPTRQETLLISKYNLWYFDSNLIQSVLGVTQASTRHYLGMNVRPPILGGLDYSPILGDVCQVHTFYIDIYFTYIDLFQEVFLSSTLSTCDLVSNWMCTTPMNTGGLRAILTSCRLCCLEVFFRRHISYCLFNLFSHNMHLGSLYNQVRLLMA